MKQPKFTFTMKADRVDPDELSIWIAVYAAAVASGIGTGMGPLSRADLAVTDFRERKGLVPESEEPDR